MGCSSCSSTTLAIVVGVCTLLYVVLKVITAGPKPIELAGKKVIITGGSSGIGKATAVALVKAGAHVSIIARNAKSLEETLFAMKAVNSANVVCHSEAGDVSVPEDIARAIDACVSAMGGVDVLITSAGYSRPGRFEDVPLADWEGQMRVNYLGTVYSIRAVLDKMKKQRFGRILLVSSLGGLSGVAGLNSYSPTKFALRGLAEGLHMETAPFGIAVSVVNPPDVDTPLLARELAFKPPECRQISEGSGLFTAEQIANDILAGLRNWKFFINTGFDGQAAALLCLGNAPSSSPSQAVLEIVSLPILRFMGLFYTYRFNSIVKKVYRQREMAGEFKQQ